MEQHTRGNILTVYQLEQFQKKGYLIIRGLFQPYEVKEINELFMKLLEGEALPFHFEKKTAEEAHGDILKQYPRFLHPHKINDTAKQYMIHPNVMNVLAELLNEEPLAVQSMFYYKPPGARGQALHQDNFYLKTQPGTCIAAWTAIDSCDLENGGMMIVPGSQNLDMICPEASNSKESFTQAVVKVPNDLKAIPAIMEPGDVLFFNGSVIHGSGPNRSKDRFRRSFTCHYVGKSTTSIGDWYNQLYTRNGQIVTREVNGETGPCGEEYMGYHEPH